MGLFLFLFSSSPQTAFSEDLSVSNQTVSNQTVSNQTVSNQTVSNQTVSQTPNSRYQILNEILSWNLYDFTPDTLISTNMTKIPKNYGHSLLFNGNSSNVEYGSVLVNTTNIITAAWVKPVYAGKNNYVVINNPAGFTLELKNHTRNYYAELSIYEENRWHIFQFPDAIKEKWTYLYAMHDGKSAIIGVNGNFKEVKMNHDEDKLLDDTEYAKYEDIPSDVVNYVGDRDPHMHVGTMHFHIGHWNFFSGQIGNVIIYPMSIQTPGMSFIPSNATEISTVPSNATSTNVTQLPTNVTQLPTNVTQLPTNVTQLPTNVTVPTVELPLATESMNFSNTLNASNVLGRAKLSQTGINGTSLELTGKGLVIQNATPINKVQELTVSAWVKPDYSQGSRDFTVLSKERTFSLVIHNIVPPTRIAVFSIFDGVTWHSVESKSEIPQRWTHLGATFNGTSISIYVNGKKESDIPVNASMYGTYGGLQTKTIESIGSNADVLIGGQQDLAGTSTAIKNLFSGKIDQVSLYNSTLSEAQMSAIYEKPSDSYKIEDIPITPHNVLSQTSYLITEKPRLKFEYIDDATLQKEQIYLKKSTEPVQLSKWVDPTETINVNVFDSNGGKIDLKSQFKKLQEGKFDIVLDSMRGGKAGLYKIKITLVKGNQTYVTESYYQWGLVSLNTDKSIYRPGQIANFTIVVLDNGGHSVCNSNVVMNIIDPQGHATLLSSGNGITPNSECGLYDSTYTPNYEGNYTVNIIAQNPSGTASFNTSFLAQNNIVFDIIRTAQSKIDPIDHPNLFNVKINFTSFVHTHRTIIKEFIPSVFDIKTDANVQTIGDTKVLTWTKDLINNMTSIQYNYSTPMQYPQLYALGPVEINYGQNQTFTEARPWFVAVDPANYRDSGSVTSMTACPTKKLLTTIHPVASSGSEILIIAPFQFASVNAATSTANVYVNKTGTALALGNNTFPIDTTTNLGQGSHNSYTVLVHDAAVSANPTYTFYGCINTANRVNINVKPVVLVGMTNNAFVAPNSVSVGTSDTQIASVTPTSIPSGNNIVIASIELQNTAASAQTINIGNIKVWRGAVGTGTVITSNAFKILLGTSSPNIRQSISLEFLDANQASNQQYSVSIAAPNSAKATARIMVFQSTASYFNSGSITNISNSATQLASVTATSFSSSSAVVIATQEFNRTTTGNTNTIAAAANTLAASGTTVTSNTYVENAPSAGNTAIDGWKHTLAWNTNSSTSSPTYSVSATASAATGLQGQAEILAFLPYTPYYKSLTGDTVGLNDHLTGTATLSRQYGDSIGLNDTLTVIKVTHVSLTGISLGLVDHIDRTISFTRSYADSLGLVDTFAKSANLTRPQTSSLGFNDTLSVMKTVSVSFPGNSLGLNDTLIKTATLLHQSGDSLGFNDTLIKTATISHQFTDSAALSDTIRLTKIGSDQYSVPDNQTNLIVHSTKPNLVVTSSSAALASITIPSNVTASTLSYSHIISSGTVHLLHTLNITKDTNADNKPEIVVTIPAVTDIYNSAWDGILQLPSIKSTSPVIPTPQGQAATVKTEISLGSSLQLTFNNATRILFVGQAGSHVGFFYAPISVTEITQTCSSDTQNAGNALPTGGSCTITVGSNLIVWTKHFTGFVTWTLSSIPPTPPSPQIPTSSGGYGTGVITSGMLGGGTTGVESAAGMLSTGVTLYDVTYDICDKQNVQFTIGSPDQTIPSVRFATASGVVEAKVSSHQPYAGLYDMVKQNVISYDATLKPGTKTFNMLVVPGNGTGYVTAKIDVTKCKQTVTFAPIPIIGQYSPNVPKIFDVKLQTDNQTITPASETQDKYVKNQNVTVYGLVFSPVKLDHAEIRTVKVGTNASSYSAIIANVIPIQVSNTYLVSATISGEYLTPPAINYWVYAKNVEGYESESDLYSVGVSPDYDVSGSIGLVIPQNVPAGLTQTPQVYFTNNSTGVLYGTISLVVDGKQVSQFTDHIFDRGTSVMELDWDVPKTSDTTTHTVQAIASFYGHTIESDKAEIHSYALTKVIPLDNLGLISSVVDGQGNVVSTPKSIYSSFVSDNATRFHIVSPGGQCVIGESKECLVDESTMTKSARSSSITVDGQTYNVYYSGANSPLQRFTITSPEPIVGGWKITLEKNGIEQKDLEGTTLLKIKFGAIEKQLLVSLP